MIIAGPDRLARRAWRALSPAALAQLTPTETLCSGEVIGEQELLERAEEATHRVTVISQVSGALPLLCDAT